MQPLLTVVRVPFRAALLVALALLLPVRGAEAGTVPEVDSAQELAVRYARMAGRGVRAWYVRTPASERVTWGGLAASAGLGLGVLLERLVRLRRTRIVPREFVTRYLERLREGRLDRGKALDFCELNPSPAARVALAAVKRWGRPIADLERATTLAHRLEVERLRHNVGTLRRIAALAPLVGLLGTLLSTGRILSGAGATTLSATVSISGPSIAAALSPLTCGVVLSILALVAYDGLVARIEGLAETLDRIGIETIDTIAMAAPPAGSDHREGAYRTHSAGASTPDRPMRSGSKSPTP